MSARDVLRSFAESRSADHEPIPARLTYGQVREALRLIEELETRVRPVAEWGSGEHVQSLSLGSVDLGNVVRMATRVPAWEAWDAIAEQGSPPFPDPRPARAWLEERVRAAGFKIREEVSDG